MCFCACKYYIEWHMLKWVVCLNCFGSAVMLKLGSTNIVGGREVGEGGVKKPYGCIISLEIFFLN